MIPLQLRFFVVEAEEKTVCTARCFLQLKSHILSKIGQPNYPNKFPKKCVYLYSKFRPFFSNWCSTSCLAAWHPPTRLNLKQSYHFIHPDTRSRPRLSLFLWARFLFFSFFLSFVCTHRVFLFARPGELWLFTCRRRSASFFVLFLGLLNFEFTASRQSKTI